MKKALIWAPLLVVGLCLAGCGGSSSSNGILGKDNPRVRAINEFSDVGLVNATSDNTNGNTNLLTNSTFGSVGAYAIVGDGTRTITFTNASNSLAITSAQENLHLDTFYTVIGTGSGVSGRKMILLSEDRLVSQNQTKMRFVNADEDHTNVDVYVTSTSTGTLTGQTPQTAGVAYTETPTPTYAPFTPGTFTIWVTAAGDPSTILAKKNVTFDANTEITLLLVKTTSGTNVQVVTDNPVPVP